MQKNYKKFALIGTSCVGKTTIIQKLPDRLRLKNPNVRIALVDEAARYYFEKKNVRKPFSFFNQAAVQKLVKQFEKQAHESKADFIVCDRSVVDAVAYVWSTGDKAGAKKLMKRVEKWFHTYDMLFLLDPKGITYKTDTVRKESIETREKFHQAFLEVLPQTAVTWVQISGPLEKRLQKIADIIYTPRL